MRGSFDDPPRVAARYPSSPTLRCVRHSDPTSRTSGVRIGVRAPQRPTTHLNHALRHGGIIPSRGGNSVGGLASQAQASGIASHAATTCVRYTVQAATTCVRYTVQAATTCVRSRTHAMCTTVRVVPPPSSRPACGGSGASGTPVAGLQAPAVALAVGLRLRCCTSSQQRHTRQLSMSSHHSLGRERGSVGRLGMASPLHLRRISWHLLYISLGSRAPASRSRFLACSFTLAFLLATSCSFAFLARSRLF